MNATETTRWDTVIVGGGLQGCLLALALRHFRPADRVVLLERGPALCGNHTWSFHALDLPEAARPFLAAHLSAEWPGYHVAFPGYARRVDSPYATLRSNDLAAAVAASGCEVRLGAAAKSLDARRVELADGTMFAGRGVIDARGGVPEPGSRAAAGRGYQKFLGLEIATDEPWPEALPTLMDATVPQDDGFRFVYALPFTPHAVLVEETYFSDTPGLDRETLRGRVRDYVGAKTTAPYRVVREESGVLPMPWRGPGSAVELPEAGAALKGGYRGGWFHPATGYSFPQALRFALAVAAVPPEEAAEAAARLAGRIAPRQRFARFLNWLLFRLVAPESRWRLFRRLYRALPDALMARFYALEFNRIDALRLVVGWPPPIRPLRPFFSPEVRPCPLSNP